MKKVLSLLLIACMLACTVALFPMNVLAAEEGETAGSTVDHTGWTAISTPEQFMAMEAGADKMYYLTNDIDFSTVDLTGKVYLTSAESFKGTFDGNGYTLKNIKLENGDKSASIFGNWFGGKCMNVTIGEPENPAIYTGGDSVAALAATNSGNSVYENVTVYAKVTNTKGKAAGFCCYFNDGTTTLKNCKMYGTVDAVSCAGGFIYALGGPSGVTMENCENYATVTTATGAASGFVCNANCTVTIKDSVNYGNVTAGASAGGFYTADGGGAEIHMTIEGCANYGDIKGADWRAGGIMGQLTTNGASTLFVNYCFNAGNVDMYKTGGEGISAGVIGGMGEASGIISNVYNVGTVTCDTPKNTVAYEIAYAGNGSTHQVVNAFYLNADGLACSSNVTMTNVQACADAAAILAEFDKNAQLDDAYRFVAGPENSAPVLQKIDAYAGTIAPVDGEANKYTIDTENFAVYMSSRAAAEAGKSDLRLVLAIDLAAKDCKEIYMNVVFRDASGAVVKTCQKNLASLSAYSQSATAAGNTYIPGQGVTLSGLVITNVPDADWATVAVSLSTGTGAATVFVVGSASAATVLAR